MVLGTVSATDVTAQPLRLDYITTKPLSPVLVHNDLARMQGRCAKVDGPSVACIEAAAAAARVSREPQLT